MDTKTLHSTSWGRIYMMLRADLVSNRRTIITLMLTLITLVYCLPRIIILSAEADYSTFLRQWRAVYELEIVEWVMMVSTLIYYWYSVNRRIVHSQPTLFSTLPAQLWEKLVSLGLYALVLTLLYLGASRLEFLIEYLTVPNMPWARDFFQIHFIPMLPAELFNFSPIGFGEWVQNAPNNPIAFITNILAALGIWFFLQTSFLVAMTHIRNTFVAFFVHFLGLTLCVVGLFSITQNFFMGHIGSGVDLEYELSVMQIWNLVVNAYIWGWVLLFIYLCRRKLKTIAS